MRRWLLLLALGALAGCAEPLTFGVRECYEIPKYHWDRCPFPSGHWEPVALPDIGYDGTRFR